MDRLPGTASFVFEAIEGEGLILRLDLAGVCGSTGSACSTGSLDPSHVLMAIGLPHEIAHGSLRLTLGEENTEEDVDYIIEDCHPGRRHAARHESGVGRRQTQPDRGLQPARISPKR